MSIQMFSDETTSNTKSFYIYSSIFGNKNSLKRLELDIENIVNANKALLGSNYKELKANRLNSKNIKTIGKVYVQVFERINWYLTNKEIGYIVSLYSKEKHEDNIDFLTGIVKNLLISGRFDSYFPELTPSDYPAIYYRINHLMLFFKFRHLIAKSNVTFELFPDSSGKILNFKEKRITVYSPISKMSMQTTFYDGIRIIGNTICKFLIKINLKGWTTQSNHINKYEPLDSKKNRIIQLCDAISNFTFNSLKYQLSVHDAGSSFKFNLLADNLFCRDGLIDLSNKFYVNSENDLCCQNDLMGNFSIYP